VLHGPTRAWPAALGLAGWGLAIAAAARALFARAERGIQVNGG
jgi:hypothetical protein